MPCRVSAPQCATARLHRDHARRQRRRPGQ
jgi:hypothetical protein